MDQEKGNFMKFRTARAIAIFFALVLIGGTNLPADANELFKMVDDTKLQKIENYNKTFLAESRYFAKRSRIVEVDPKVLFGDDEVVMNLFDDIVLLIERTSPSEERAHIWKGRIIDPAPPIYEFGVDEEKLAQLGMTKEKFYEFVSGIQLAVNELSASPTTGEVFLTGFQENFAVMSPDAMSRAENPVRANSFYSVRGDVQYGPVTYRVRPLQFMPRYHLIYEIDHRKLFSDPSENDYSMIAEEEREKAKDYREYQSTLPSVEGKAILWGVQ